MHGRLITLPRRLQTVAHALMAWGGSVPGALFIFFACLYILTYQGRVNTFDGQSIFATTRALGDRASLAITHHSLGVRGVGNEYYSKYGIGQSLVELPFYLAGKVLGLFAGSRAPQVAEAVTMLVNPLLMAGVCATFYAVVCLLGMTRNTALRATLVLGIATSLWPYSKSDFSEPLLALCFLLATYWLLRPAQLVSTLERVDDVKAYLLRVDLLVGFVLGCAVLTKYAAIAFVPGFCLYTLLTLPQPRSILLATRRLIAILVPVGIGGLGVLLVDTLRFGSPLVTGYASWDHPFSTPIERGLYGILISPYRGLVFYDPLLFVGLLCAPVLLWRWRREALLLANSVIISLLLYGSYVAWDAGPAWGPRYLVPMMPFLMWPLLALGAFGGALPGRDPVLLQGMARRLAVAASATLAVVSTGIQFLGVAVNYYVHDNYWLVGAPGTTFLALKSSLAASPLATMLWALPMSLYYAFTKSFPASGYASSDYPFGPPFPTGPNMPQHLGDFFAQTFWFTLLPHPPLVFAVGAVVLGVGMVFSARVLLRHAWRLPPSKNDEDQRGASMMPAVPTQVKF